MQVNIHINAHLNVYIDVHMGHRPQDGKKVDEMSLFFLKWEAGTDR